MYAFNKKIDLTRQFYRYSSAVATVSLLVATSACSTLVTHNETETTNTLIKHQDAEPQVSQQTDLLQQAQHQTTQQVAADTGEQTDSVSAEEEKWGIRIVALRRTMAGMMVDFRYKVIDPVKAAPLLDLNTKAFLEVEKSGAVLGVPNSVKVGALRQTTHAKKVKKDRDYFIMFGNPRGNLAKAGDKVAVVIGDFRAENLSLQ